MNCVCTHSRDEHKPTVMSVPLTAKTPTYPLPNSRVNNITLQHPTATYDTVQCHCGCQEYLPDG